MLCRNLATELGLTCIEPYKMDATTALQQPRLAQDSACQAGKFLLAHSIVVVALLCIGCIGQPCKDMSSPLSIGLRVSFDVVP